MKFIAFALAVSLLLVAILSAQTGKTYNYALYSAGTRTRVWTGSSWADPGQIFEPMFSDTANPSCVGPLLPGSGFAIALSSPVVVRRIWLNLEDPQAGSGCNAVIKVAASGAPTTVLYSNTTGFESGSRVIELTNTVAYKYFTIESGNSMSLFCKVCGFEVFTG